VGFILNSASTFTSTFSRRWGKRKGQWASVILRDVFGIPLWVIGLAMAVREPAQGLISTGPVTEILVWSLMITGCGVMICGLGMLGKRAAAPTMEDKLEERGIYAFIRHPIYTGLIIEFCGNILLKPTWPVMIACGLGLIWIPLQARLEEKDLVERLPGYRDYMQRVPRFFPHISHLHKE